MNEAKIKELMALVRACIAADREGKFQQAQKKASELESALREQVREVPDESPGEGWDSFFEKRLPSLARAHPSLLVRQLAQRMLSAAPTQPAQAEQPAPAGSGGWKAHAEDMERERNYWRSRANLMHEHQTGQVWYWQGDGEDHLESICNSLPVVIRADVLRALVADSSQPKSMQHEQYILLWDVVKRQLKVIDQEGARAIESATAAPLLESLSEKDKRIADLEQQLEAARKDAERWNALCRWAGDYTKGAMQGFAHVLIPGSFGIEPAKNAAALTDAVDAAISKDKTSE